MTTEFKITADGSHTLFVPELNEHYHSTFGAIQEALHIFINSGLKMISKNQISIFEAGFGTGLNAFLTLNEAFQSKIIINYTAIELFPLPIQIINQLNYKNLIQSECIYLFDKLHHCEWNTLNKITDYYNITKIKNDLVEYQFSEKFDLIYFDAFAPEIQPDLWSETIFRKLYNCLNNDGILVTYSSKGIVKQALRNAGFIVKRLPGPKGKRHILKAEK